MTELKIDWTAENLKKYILFTSFFGNKYAKISIGGFTLCFAVIVGTCIAMFCLSGMLVFIILVCLVTVCSAGYLLFFAYTIKKNIVKALETGSENDPDSVIVTADAILLCKGNEPFGELAWKKISSISFNDKDGAVYLSAEGGAVLILEYKNITAGSKEKLREILIVKNAELSNKA